SDCRPSRRSWITMRRLKCDNPLWIFRVTTFSRSISSLTEHHDRVAIGPGEAFCGRLAPRQPDEAEMLVGRHAHRHAAGQAHGKHMLDVVQDARGKAMTPLLVDLERIDGAPALEATGARVDARLLVHLPCGGAL